MAKAKPTKEIGGSGTIIVGGMISGHDYNTDLTGTQGIKVYDQMRLGDATVRATLLVVKLPVISASWNVQPASEDARDVEIAEFVEDNLMHRMNRPWPDLLRELMLYLDYGRMVFEKVYELSEDGKIRLAKLGPRMPGTIQKWETEGGQPGITQWLPTGGFRSIPREKLVLFVNEQEGDNYEGISLLRPAYKHWYYKDGLYKVEAMSVERQGLGIPKVKIPSNATKADEAKAEELARNLRANEEAFVTLKGESWEVEILDMKGGSVKDAQPAIQHHDLMISKSILAQFINLAGNATGSYSLSQNDSEYLLMCLQAVGWYISDVFDHDVIRELVDLNYAGVEKYPLLQFSKIGKVDIGPLAAALKTLKDAKLITPDPNLERDLRAKMDLPELPDDIEPASIRPEPTPQPQDQEDVKEAAERANGLITAIETEIAAR
jgi:hypothetical protein